MKKLLLIATAAIMLCIACSKENIHHKKIILSEISDIEKDIIAFLDNINEPNEGSLPVDDAIFFLEAGFNYRYAHAGNDIEMAATTMDTSFINLPVYEGYSSYTDLNAAFEDIYNVSFSSKHYASDSLMNISDNPNQFGYEDKLLFKHVQSTYYVTHCMTQGEIYYYASLLPTAISHIETYEGITKYLIGLFFLCRQTQSPDLPDALYQIQHGIQLMHGDWINTTHIATDDFFAN